ncbi:hypothetical protein ABPG77_006934 [Micractinium sp. CCAP 211/92]
MTVAGLMPTNDEPPAGSRDHAESMLHAARRRIGPRCLRQRGVSYAAPGCWSRARTGLAGRLLGPLPPPLALEAAEQRQQKHDQKVSFENAPQGTKLKLKSFSMAAVLPHNLPKSSGTLWPNSPPHPLLAPLQSTEAGEFRGC